ncbi:hypothetical protein [Streptomyces lycii]|uniref:Uncharacterized protein n=1 Tax=Streptomyces lycii TaxID=2654337 RepID=A0ABQ7FR01_9ACTN|nr:hypothetical protein [Streptomyces lycii]KAF4410915.1 hypothetical protein GCU69_01460 [Streptomyces lycii]
MNGYEHYKLAEKYADKAHSAYDSAEMAAIAQVHATLALAAATADANNFKRDLYAGNGEELPAVKRTEAKSSRAADAFLD